RARRAVELLREDRARGRLLDALGRRPEAAGLHRLVVEPRGRRDRPGDPVDHHVGEELILREAALDVAVAVAPGAELLDDPRGEPGGRVVEAVAERLRLGALDLLIAGLVGLERAE